MAATDLADKAELERELERERRQLAASVNSLRRNADLTAQLRQRMPLLLIGTFAAAFVLAGGVGATMRLIARQSRESNEAIKVGRFRLTRT
jgi:hypothetical protein